MHITEQKWKRQWREIAEHDPHDVPIEITKIRTESKLRVLLQALPEAMGWLTNPYAHREIKRAMQMLK